MDHPNQSHDLEDLKRKIAIGIEQADRNEFVKFTAEDIIREGREILARRTCRSAECENPNS